MKAIKISILLLLSTLIFSCKQSKFKTIDFESFEITVPQTWDKIELSGTDSYVLGLETEEQDTLIFDIGRYSGDITKYDFPLVFDKNSYAELSEKDKKLLKNTKHLIVDTLSAAIDFKKYLKHKYSMIKIDCFHAKLITPINKQFGTTGIYIDSLSGTSENFDRVKMSFYGNNLKDKTQEEFITSLKSIKLKEYCQN